MARLNLTADNPNEKRVLAYLEENASDDLVRRINENSKKTLSGCWNFIVQQARQQAKHGCACVEDRVVFGWAIHYFEENIDAKSESEARMKNFISELKPNKEETQRKEKELAERRAKEKEELLKKKQEEKENRKQVPGQLDMFSLLGGM